MYLVVIGWLYVAVLMAVAEATNSNGTLLGAIVTFLLYGLLPVALVAYILNTPARRRAIKARELQEARQTETSALNAESGQPDAGGQSTAAAEANRVASVREEH